MTFIPVYNPHRTMIAKGEWVEGFSESPVHNALTAQDPPKGPSVVVAFSENQRAELVETEYAHALSTSGGKPGVGYPAIREGMGVRRLTPLECERLQGFPDNHTAMHPDTTRYRQMGNAVAVPVFEWVARRIAMVTARQAAA